MDLLEQTMNQKLKGIRVYRLKKEHRQINRNRRKELNQFAREHNAKETIHKILNNTFSNQMYFDYLLEINIKYSDMSTSHYSFSTICISIHKCKEEKNKWLERVIKVYRARLNNLDNIENEGIQELSLEVQQ